MSKKNTLFNDVDDSRSVAHDFRLRYFDIFGGYGTLDYRVSPGLEESAMLAVLEERIKKLISSECIDCGNGNVLDDLILSIGVEAEAKLRRQAVSHREIIRWLSVRRKADKEDFARIETKLRSEIESLEADYANIMNAIEREKGDKHV
jgi:hypothetical protein